MCSKSSWSALHTLQIRPPMAILMLTMSHTKKLHLLLNTFFLFLLSFYLITTTTTNPSLHHFKRSLGTDESDLEDSCINVHNQQSREAKCWYVRSNKACQSQGYIDYLQFFYCNCSQHPALAYALLLTWLVLLFYVSGNTAANYFCSSLEGLSKVLNLSPTIAGVTFLSLGNGASDVFTTIVSFMGSGVGQVGLNSVLGGAFFVSSVVAGIISICVGSKGVFIDKSSFTRDVLFLIITLLSLLLIISDGKIDVWNATAFVFLYFLYIFAVCTTRLFSDDPDTKEARISSPSPSRTFFAYEPEEFSSTKLDTPLLSYVSDEKLVSIERIGLEDQNSRSNRYLFWVLYVLQLPLHLPRKLTIPVVSEERWSKPFSVCSVTLAPVLLAALLNSQSGEMGSKSGLLIYSIGGLIGAILGVLAYGTTEKSSPPKRCLVLWLLGGFFMSVIWSYIVAKELVAFLVSLGTIFGISPSILGLTVLAWGNSLGDLMANLATAMKGSGSDGAQVAISGCIAGPLFNILIGLGLSFVFASWAEYPSHYIIPKDSSLYLTIGFFICGLLFALVILPRQNMKLGKFFGAGLLSIYLCFVSLRFAETLC